MAEYKPSLPFTVPMIVYTPSYEKTGGVRSKVYPDSGFLIFGTFKTFGGTESTVNGVYSIIDTAEIETWFRPDITSDCMIELAETSNTESPARYEILGDVENINRRNQYLKFRVRRFKGGA